MGGFTYSWLIYSWYILDRKQTISYIVCKHYYLDVSLTSKKHSGFSTIRWKIDNFMQFKLSNYLKLSVNYWGVFCSSGLSSGKIAPWTGHTWRQIPQSIQVEKSIQYQSVPFVFLLGPSWMQATGQASTQSATPSQTSVTIVWAKTDSPWSFIKH